MTAMQHHRQPLSLPRGRGELPWGSARTVLIVEDEPALLQVLQALLEDAGYHVVTAANGRIALQRYHEEGADLVLTDYLMPEMDGSELMRALGAGRPGRPPVVVMSSMDERVVAHACPGYARFFRKPFDVIEFLEALDALTSEPDPRKRLRLVK